MKTIIDEKPIENWGGIKPPLRKMAIALQELLSSISYEDWELMSDDEKYDLCYDYLAENYEFEEILNRSDTEFIVEDDIIEIIIDDYYKIRIIIIEEEEKSITEKLREEIKDIHDWSKWKVQKEGHSYLLDYVYEDYCPPDILFGKTLKEFINDICTAIEQFHSECPGMLYGYEDEEEDILEYEISENEIKIIYKEYELNSYHTYEIKCKKIS